jgi:hypothetical protein
LPSGFIASVGSRAGFKSGEIRGRTQL